MQSLILSHKWLDKYVFDKISTIKKFDAVNLYFIILVRKEHETNEALIAHEKHHTKQVEEHGIMYIYKYNTDPQFRLEMESAAYAVQVLAGDSLDGCARSLWKLYDLNISFIEAKQAIYQQIFNMRLG